MMNAANLVNTVVALVGSSEQTEAYVFATLELRGVSREVVDEAIGLALDAGRLFSTVIDCRDMGAAGVVLRGRYEPGLRRVRS